jgi:two-component system sensor histidine kinase CiaH
VNFRRSLIKLTLGYLILIMLVCGILSYGLYRLGGMQLERRLELRQEVMTHDPFMMGTDPHFLDPHAVQEVKHRLGLSLIYFNVAVLCIAGLVSYGLAKRELKPMETALDLQSRFTSDAAHELRTPLTAMKAEIEVALRGGQLTSDEARELLESNLEEIDKLESLSSSLLKLAQYEESTARTRAVGANDLGAVLEEAIDRVKRTAEVRGIRIEPVTEEAKVTGDRDSLVELFVILLDNSIKYSDDKTTVTVAAHPQKRQAVIAVKDEGYGISSEDLDHVFDRFYRGKFPAEKKQVSGYGLGLSIAKRIAEINRGTIEIRSKSGQGTTVTVKLPLGHQKAGTIGA